MAGVTNQKDADLVRKVAGVYPTIRGGDLIDYSPSRVEHAGPTDKPIDPTDKMIERANAGDVLTMLWHWNAPTGLLDKMSEKDGKPVDLRWYRGFYTEATTFDVAAALDDPSGPNYALLLRDIDAIAVQLKKYKDAGIPILWRPLHEADGKWFWWGAKGSAPFKRLWSLLYDRLTHHHHLNNLIWVYTASDNFEWFPPDNEFDVIGVDLYPTDMHDPASPIWDALQARYAGKKMLAIAEFGGVPDLETMAKLGVRWSYFCSWGGKLGPEKPSPDELKRLYHAPTIETR